MLAAIAFAAAAATAVGQLSPSTAYRPPWADNIVKVQVFNAGAGAYRSMCLTPDRSTLYATGSQLRPAILAVDTARLSVRDLLPFALNPQWDITTQAIYCPVAPSWAGVLFVLTNDAVVLYDVAGRTPLLRQQLTTTPASYHAGWAIDAAER